MLGAGPSVSLLLDAGQAGRELFGTAHVVVGALHPFDDTLTIRSVGRTGQLVDPAVDLVTLHADDSKFPVAVRRAAWRGDHTAGRAASRPHFAPAVLSDVIRRRR